MKPSFGSDKFLTKGFDSYVEPRYIDVANTDIVGRAQVLDRANMLMPTMGVDRVHTEILNKVDDEFGPNGEPVYRIENDDRIRFVGNWSTSVSTYGTRAYTSGSSADYIEIVMYGTGLNILTSQAVTQVLTYQINGGASSSDFYVSGSDVLGGRSYEANIVMTAFSNETLGWKTVKISRGNTNTCNFFGFEILNEQTALTVSPGKAYYGPIVEYLGAQDTLAYDSGFTGTKGGRAVAYIKDGALGIAKQEVDATALYLTNADHSNEEVDYVMNYVEAGVGRSDDFSNCDNSDRNLAFTVGDGTTTWVGNSVNNYSGEAPAIGSNGDFITITFTGCGCDLIRRDNTTGTEASDKWPIYIDGSTIGNGDNVGAASKRIEKIASGLPYGTHTVKVLNNGGSSFYNYGVSDIIVYKPKKPTLPTGAIELADYNVMADFVANTTAGLETISTGVVRKSCARELTYKGSWALNLNVGTIGGHYALTSTNGDFVEYTFWGSGFDIRFACDSSRSTDIRVTLNGSALITGNFGTASFNVYGTGVTYDGSTLGSLDANDVTGAVGSGFACSNLPFDKYTVRFTNNTANQFDIQAFDIITPIHVNNVNVGSLSLLDTRKTSPVANNDSGLEVYSGRIPTYAWTNITSFDHNPDYIVTKSPNGDWYFEITGSLNPSGTVAVDFRVPGVRWKNSYTPVVWISSTSQGVGRIDTAGSNQISSQFNVSGGARFWAKIPLKDRPDFIH